MGTGSQQGGGGGYGAPQMGSGYGMPGGGIASMMGGMSPGMGGGMFGQQGGPMGGQGGQFGPFMGGQSGRGQFGPPGGGFMGGGGQFGPMNPMINGYPAGGQFGGQQGGPGGQMFGFNDFRKTDMTGGGPMRPGVMYNQGPGNMGGGQGTPTTKPPPPQFMGGGQGTPTTKPPPPQFMGGGPRNPPALGLGPTQEQQQHYQDMLPYMPKDANGNPISGGPAIGPYGGPPAMGGGITQLFNPGGGGATQQGQSQMIADGQYTGMQGQPGGQRNTLPYFPGGPGMGHPGDQNIYRTQTPMMGQFGAL